MNRAAYVKAAVAATRARIAGETNPDELTGIAVDAVVDSDIVLVNEDFEFDGPEARDAIDSVFKALRDLGIIAQ